MVPKLECTHVRNLPRIVPNVKSPCAANRKPFFSWPLSARISPYPHTPGTFCPVGRKKGETMHFSGVAFLVDGWAGGAAQNEWGGPLVFLGSAWHVSENIGWVEIKDSVRNTKPEESKHTHTSGTGWQYSSPLVFSSYESPKQLRSVLNNRTLCLAHIPSELHVKRGVVDELGREFLVHPLEDPLPRLCHVRLNCSSTARLRKPSSKTRPPLRSPKPKIQRSRAHVPMVQGVFFVFVFLFNK